MQTTTNYGLKKPEETDFYNIDEMVNENMDIIDEKLHECFQSVSNGKKLIASAITDKGVATASDATFAVMAENIENIETSPNLQAKTATLDTTKTSVILTPDSGYDGLSKATVSITTQSKSAALSTSAQTIKPDSGKVLSAVSIPAIEGTAAVGDVLAGKTFNSATAGIKKTGTIVNRKGATVDAIAVSQDDTYTYFKTPAGCYSAESMVRTENSNLIKYGTFSFPVYNTSIEIDLGFKPSIVIVMVHKGNNTVYLIYDTRQDIYLRGFTIYSDTWGFNETDLNGDVSLTDSGFMVTNKLSTTVAVNGGTTRYYAMR